MSSCNCWLWSGLPLWVLQSLIWWNSWHLSECWIEVILQWEMNTSKRLTMVFIEVIRFLNWLTSKFSIYWGGRICYLFWMKSLSIVGTAKGWDSKFCFSFPAHFFLECPVLNLSFTPIMFEDVICWFRFVDSRGSVIL